MTTQRKRVGLGGLSHSAMPGAATGSGTLDNDFWAHDNPERLKLTELFTTGTGFGSGSGFGSTPKPAFGSTPNTGGGIFGNNNNNTSTASTGGFGGFGSTAQSSSTPFGSTSASQAPGLFGASKPLFGGSATTGTGGVFGNAPTTTNTTFGGGSTGLFGGASNTATNECQGTGGTPFSPHSEKEPGSSATNLYQSITFMQPYSKWSFEVSQLDPFEDANPNKFRNYV